MLKGNDKTENALEWTSGGRGSRVSFSSYQLKPRRGILYISEGGLETLKPPRSMKTPHTAKGKDPYPNHGRHLFAENRVESGYHPASRILWGY